MKLQGIELTTFQLIKLNSGTKGKCRIGLSANEVPVVQRLDAKGVVRLDKLVKHRMKSGMLYPFTASVSIVGQVTL